jgi:hypothetical protein
MSSDPVGLKEPAPAPAPAEAVRAREQLKSILGFEMRIYRTEAQIEAEAEAKAKAEAEAKAEAKAEAEAEVEAIASELSEPPPSSGEDFKKLLSMLAAPRDLTKNGGGGGGSSSSSTSTSGSAALEALRQGWDPFAELPKPLDVLTHEKNERLKKSKKRVHEFSHLAMARDERLAPVSPASLVVTSLPVRLGRNDVFDKREKKGRMIDRTQVPIVVGKNDVHSEELAQKMRRSQEFADRDNRRSIFVECMREWSE